MNVKQYKNLITAFFNSHAQINTVLYGNPDQFNASSKILYPVANVEYIDNRPNGLVNNINFLITLADIYDPNLESSDLDIYSDCDEIANDCINYFANNYDLDYQYVNESVTITPFNNGHDDKVCGASFLLTFTESRTANACVIPYKTI